jgi:endonuclease III
LRTVIWELFARWPDAPSLAGADPGELEELLRPLGLWRQRAKRLKEFSKEYEELSSGEPIGGLPGIGKYAEDSWLIFVEGELEGVEPDDPELAGYLEWARGRARDK